MARHARPGRATEGPAIARHRGRRHRAALLLEAPRPQDPFSGRGPSRVLPTLPVPQIVREGGGPQGGALHARSSARLHALVPGQARPQSQEHFNVPQLHQSGFSLRRDASARRRRAWRRSAKFGSFPKRRTWSTGKGPYRRSPASRDRGLETGSRRTTSSPP